MQKETLIRTKSGKELKIMTGPGERALAKIFNNVAKHLKSKPVHIESPDPRAPLKISLEQLGFKEIA